MPGIVGHRVGDDPSWPTAAVPLGLTVSSPSIRQFRSRVFGLFKLSPEHGWGYLPQAVMGPFLVVFIHPGAGDRSHLAEDGMTLELPAGSTKITVSEK